MKAKILEELKQNNGYVSGQALCEKLNVSRTAIWKAINRLREEGYVIDSLPNKGYRIVSYPDILSENEIKSAIGTSLIKNVIYFAGTDSTNNRAKLFGEEGKQDGTLVVADYQTKGKGRRGRSFESPGGKSIYMTLLLRPDISPVKASMITIVAAMAVRMGIEEACGVKSFIKWPNDIVAERKKLCGILTEMSAEPEHINYVVTGIGINVNNDSMPKEIENVSVSVKMLTGKEYKRSVIIASVMKWFDVYYREFLQYGNLKGIRDEYNRNLIHMEKEVEILKGNSSYKARSLGIDENGQLITERDGQREAVISGEVSVRGVYGYV